MCESFAVHMLMWCGRQTDDVVCSMFGVIRKETFELGNAFFASVCVYISLIDNCVPSKSLNTSENLLLICMTFHCKWWRRVCVCENEYRLRKCDDGKYFCGHWQVHLTMCTFRFQLFCQCKRKRCRLSV